MTGGGAGTRGKITADNPGGGGCTPGGSNSGGTVKCAALILLAVCVPDAIDSDDELVATCIN